MAVLQEDPAPLQDLGLGDELLRPGSLAPPQGDHVQVGRAAPLLLGEAQ